MKRTFTMIAAAALAALPALASADILVSQDFNSMGTGTTAPSGWSAYSLTGTHDQFKPADDPSGTGALPTSNDIKGGTANATLIAATADTTTTQKAAQGYNWLVGGVGTNRALGTSPTGVAGMILQAVITNNTGGPVTDLAIDYDVLVQSVTTNNNNNTTNNYVGIEELPGYQLWYSLDNGNSYTNVSALNANGHTWANAIGTVHESLADLTLNTTWASGANLNLRWFDDNAQGPSPDQKIGLDNLVVGTVAATPEPASLALLALGSVLMLARRRTA